MTYTEPTAIGGRTQEELDKELRKGIESIKEGKTFTADEVDEELCKRVWNLTRETAGCCFFW